MAENEIQRMADALAEKLQRSVVINDPEIRLICASRHFGDEDEVRVHAVLQRMTEKAAIGHILSHDVAQWSGPGVVPGRADIGMAARLCMPIRWQGVILGLLMVIDPVASLTGEQIDAIKPPARTWQRRSFGTPPPRTKKRWRGRPRSENY